jgi:hypothetical protein
MAGDRGCFSATEAMLVASDLRASYHHVEIDDDGREIVVWYCCSKDEALAAVERRFGYRCRVRGVVPPSES